MIDKSVDFISTTLSTSLTLSLPQAPVRHVTKYLVRYEERCGRLLVANTDIRAGEVVFTDIAAATGPDNNPRPVCLVCCARLVRGHVCSEHVRRYG